MIFMITELILTVLFGAADIFLGLLPEMEWTVNTSAWSYVGDILSMIAYLLPMGHIVAVIVVLINISAFRLIISFIKFIKGFIPLLGG